MNLLCSIHTLHVHYHKLHNEFSTSQSLTTNLVSICILKAMRYTCIFKHIIFKYACNVQVHCIITHWKGFEIVTVLRSKLYIYIRIRWPLHYRNWGWFTIRPLTKMLYRPLGASTWVGRSVNFLFSFFLLFSLFGLKISSF